MAENELTSIESSSGQSSPVLGGTTNKNPQSDLDAVRDSILKSEKWITETQPKLEELIQSNKLSQDEIDRAKSDLKEQKNYMHAVIIVLLVMVAGMVIAYIQQMITKDDQISQKLDQLQHQIYERNK